MDFSILGLWDQMGFVARSVVIILLLMSMFAIGISLERYLTFKKSKDGSLGFLAALQPMLAPGGDLSGAVGLKSQFPDAPLARIAAVGLSEFNTGVGQLGDKVDDAIEVELLLHGVDRSMERAKKREMAALNKGLPVLATISSSAPFVGLFGTVFGIITAFQQMADPAEGGGGGLATVSAGIAEALMTTAVGLGVAIGAVWFYNYFTTRLDDLGTIIDDAAGELTDRLVQKTRAGLSSAERAVAAASAANAMAPPPAAVAAPAMATSAPPPAMALGATPSVQPQPSPPLSPSSQMASPGQLASSSQLGASAPPPAARPPGSAALASVPPASASVPPSSAPQGSVASLFAAPSAAVTPQATATPSAPPPSATNPIAQPGPESNPPPMPGAPPSTPPGPARARKGPPHSVPRPGALPPLPSSRPPPLAPAPTTPGSAATQTGPGSVPPKTDGQ